MSNDPCCSDLLLVAPKNRHGRCLHPPRDVNWHVLSWCWSPKISKCIEGLRPIGSRPVTLDGQYSHRNKACKKKKISQSINYTDLYTRTSGVWTPGEHIRWSLAGLAITAYPRGKNVQGQEYAAWFEKKSILGFLDRSSFYPLVAKLFMQWRPKAHQASASWTTSSLHKLHITNICKRQFRIESKQTYMENMTGQHCNRLQDTIMQNNTSPKQDSVHLPYLKQHMTIMIWMRSNACIWHHLVGMYSVTNSNSVTVTHLQES